MVNEKAETTPITLYPKQIAIVEAFATKNGRKFSNAVQFIIEDWYAKSDPEGLLLKQHKPTTPRTARRAIVRKSGKPATSLDAIAGLRKGVTA